MMLNPRENQTHIPIHPRGKHTQSTAIILNPRENTHNNNNKSQIKTNTHNNTLQRKLPHITNPRDKHTTKILINHREQQTNVIIINHRENAHTQY